MGKRSPHEATAERSRPTFLQGRSMSSLNTISSEKLARLIGVPHGPALIDVRLEEDFAADPRFIPGVPSMPALRNCVGLAPEFAEALSRPSSAKKARS